jgi:hypothetical protein
MARSVSSTRLLPTMILAKSTSGPAPKPVPSSTTRSPGASATGVVLPVVQRDVPFTRTRPMTGVAVEAADAARAPSRAVSTLQ